MALNATNVMVGTTGGVYVAPTTAAAPTEHDSALDPLFINLGYISDAGISETLDKSPQDIRAWQNSALVRRVITESSQTFNMTFIETKKETVQLYYGASVAADGSLKIDPSKTGGRKSFVIDVIDGDFIKRTYIPSGEVTEVGDMTYSAGDPIGYEVTLTAYASTTGDESYSAISWFGAFDTTGA
ncbi:hypothetical protein [Curtobacterium sp. MCSS17_015]|uniref:phage tail tube protein n=1 Tax=Curtobacterium sp. MCSS17_015 TaxID=2175666 RepID=UPI000DA90E2A|nr:hypothetical protein [Curtobacterium sp. MCSS17_015]WIB25813.1 hypothetical protein DEJ18_12255 [Curtobacterium sp. MCSS17_015]